MQELEVMVTDLGLLFETQPGRSHELALLLSETEVVVGHCDDGRDLRWMCVEAVLMGGDGRVWKVRCSC